MICHVAPACRRHRRRAVILIGHSVSEHAFITFVVNERNFSFPDGSFIGAASTAEPSRDESDNDYWLGFSQLYSNEAVTIKTSYTREVTASDNLLTCVK